MSGSLEGKTGFVTGAANGIGKGIALTLASEGAQVMVSDIEPANEEGLAVVEEIRKAGGSAEFMTCDVSKEEDIKALVKATTELSGTLDFAVNNAGIGPKGLLTESDNDVWDKTNAINLKSVFISLRETLNVLRDQDKGGAIVNISSVAGLDPLPQIGIYAATKHGVIGLTKAAAIENGDKNIRVNAILPNGIRSKLMEGTPKDVMESILDPQAIKRRGEPEEVGAAVAFLLSDKAKFITGVSLPVDGGFLAGG